MKPSVDPAGRRRSAPLELGPAKAQELLERVIFERVIELVDLQGLAHLEHLLATELAEIIDDADCIHARDITRQMIETAWSHVLSDPRRYISFEPFPDCELCEQEAAIHRSGAG